MNAIGKSLQVDASADAVRNQTSTMIAEAIDGAARVRAFYRKRDERMDDAADRMEAAMNRESVFPDRSEHVTYALWSGPDV